QLAVDLSSDQRCEATVEEARAFLDRMLEIGVLRLRTGVAEQEAEWIAPLATFLATLDDPELLPCQELLRELECFRARYAIASAPERAVILGQMGERLSALLT